MRWLTWASVFVVALAGCRSPLIEGEGVYVIRDGTLIDGTGAAPRPNTTIVFEAGRIRQIVDAGSVRVGPDVASFDAAGKWILPGFIDTHAHLPDSSALDATFATMLAYGITAARSTASETRYAVAVRDRLENGELTGPTYRVAGALIDGPGSFWGDLDFVVTVETADDARAEVRRQAKAGVDYIKLYTLLSPDIVVAAIDEAHAHGLEVMGHLGRTTWFEALDLGIDALVHSGSLGMATSMLPEGERASFADFFEPGGRGLDPSLYVPFVEAVDTSVVHELGRRIAAQGVVLDPDLVIEDVILRGNDEDLYRALMPEDQWDDFAPAPYSAHYTESQRAAALEGRARFWEAIRILHDEGALVTAGTDMGNPWMTPGVAYHRELELLAEAGLDNAAVIRAASRNGAVALDLIDDLGTLEVGKRADVVILGADPLADIRNTSQIAAVCQFGRLVGR